ncbi:ligand-binding sensor domain-containing protein [Ekhidna sp.]|uniref:ligand-binding sensor domain-containing protein n=1 Tax=Ekhidna sp. TaxID=2608089 RepID=UPI003BABB6F9
MMRTKAAIIGLLSSFMALATVQKYDIRHFNPETGLNGTYVYTTMQGPQGYKWVGTDYGLMRFDGLKFELMDANDSTKKNFTTSSYIDENDRIYFGYFNGKIKRFNGVDFENIYDAMYEQSPVTAIVKSQDNLIAVTQNKGLIRLLKDTVEFLEPYELKYKKTNFARVYKDLILVGTNEGLLAFRFNDDNKLVYAGSVEGLNFIATQTIEQNKAADNSFWVGTDYGIYHLDLYLEGGGISGEIEKAGFLEKESISAMKETSNMDLWVGTKYDGLVKIDFNRDNAKSIQYTYLDKKHDFPGNLISTLNMDEDESIWVGTIGDGLVQVSKRGLLFYNFEEFRARSVNSISGNSKHEFYFATDVGIIRGFYTGEIDSLNFELITHETSEGNNITAIYVDDNDRIYYGVEDLGIYTADPEWQNIVKIDFDSGGGKLLARQITKDPKGNLWLSLSQRGVVVLDSLHNLVKTYSTSSGFYHNEIYHIHFDKEGNTWFASHGAGLAVERADGQIIYLTKDGVFPSHDINDISEDEFGNLWIGTHGDGIYEYDGEEFIRFSTKEGLLNDFCSAVISDKSNHVWATHRTGLSRVDEFTEAVSTIQKKDGLVVAEFIHNSIFTDQDHNIWIGNRNGVTFLSAPDKMFESKILNPIISDIKIGFNSINLFKYSSDSISGSRVPNNLEFPYNLNNLTFEFIAINLRNPEANLYQYQLVGHYDEWSPATSSTEVPFNNLSPGEYTFRVRQSDNPNHWSDNISSITFEIKPPWWGTWWAILLFASVTFGLIYGFIKWRTDRLNRRLNEKQRLISIAESQNKRLKEFSFITSHHTRSSASNIMGLIAAIEMDPTNQEFIHMLRKSSNRLNGTIRNINELLNFENDRENLSTEACSVSESIERVISQHDKLISEQEADLKVEVADEFYVQAVPTYLDSALSNLVSNALNYGVTKDKKQVFIETYEQNNEIVISVKDEGLGIDLNKFHDKVFTLGARFHSSIEQGDGIGMFLSKNQIESMGGKIAIESIAGEGTTIKLYLKKAEIVALAQ